MAEIIRHNMVWALSLRVCTWLSGHVSLSLFAVIPLRSPKRQNRYMEVSGITSSSGVHAVCGASTGAPPQPKMSNLFDSIDASGSGSITQSQFEQALQTKDPPAAFQNQGAQAIFASLDPNGIGSVSKQDFVLTMSGLMASARRFHRATLSTRSIPRTYRQQHRRGP
jgi:hypothetical protein